MLLKNPLLVCLVILGIHNQSEARHLAHETIKVTQHSATPRARRDVTADISTLHYLTGEDFPEHMEFTLHLENGDKKLTLTKYMSPYDLTQNSDRKPETMQYAVYQDRATQANVIMECSGSSDGCILGGTFYNGDTKYNIKANSDGDYDVTEVKRTSDSFKGQGIKPERSYQNTAKRALDPYEDMVNMLKNDGINARPQKKKRSNIPSTCYIIDIEVRVDTTVVDFFQAKDGADFEDRIEDHYLLLFSEADCRYADLFDAIGACLRLYLVDVVLDTSTSDPWSAQTTGGSFDPGNGLVACGAQKNAILHSDLIMCTTRNFIGAEFPRGVGFLDVLCRGPEQFRTFIIRDIGDDTDLAIASQLFVAYSIDFDGDGVAAVCDPNLQFLGSQFDEAPHIPGTETNPWHLSECSITQLDAYLSTSDASCLLLGNADEGIIGATYDNLVLPGKAFTPDFQCELTFGLGSFATIGPNQTTITDFDEVCWKGYFCDDGYGNINRSRIYNGSPCGCGKICFKNQCIRERNVTLGEACHGCCECLDDNAICDCDTKTCVCDRGFAAVNGTCEQVGGPGSNCTSDEDCVDNASCDLDSNTCECDEGFFEMDGECVPMPPMGSCSNDTLPEIQNGEFKPQGNSFGSVAFLHCNDHFVPNSIETCSVCLESGSFSQPDVYCIRDCGCPPLAVNGDFELQGGTTINETARLECCDGFEIQGYIVITCEEYGWSQPAENCSLIDCGYSLPYVPNGDFHLDDPYSTTFGSLATIKCDYGYVPKYPDVCSVCQQNGYWSDPGNECIRDCGCPPQTDNNGRFELDKEDATTLYETATLTCCDGFETDYDYVQITCEDTSDGWSYPSDYCKIKDCGLNLPRVTAGAFVANHGTTVNSVATLQCDPGFVPYPPLDSCIVCDFDGYWSTPKAGCKKDCGYPDNAFAGRWELDVPGETTLGATATLVCCPVCPPSNVTITCEPYGWSDPDGNCTLEDCGYDLPDVDDGDYHLAVPDTTIIGSLATLKCDYGFVPSDASAVCSVCLPSGYWSDPGTECIRDCGDPNKVETPDGSFVLDVHDQTTLNSTATLSCCNGYGTQSSYVRITCDRYGWSDPSEYCAINDCGYVPGIDNGEFELHDPYTTTVNSLATLKCDDNYTAQTCDICIVCLFNGSWSQPKTQCVFDCGLPPMTPNGQFVLEDESHTTVEAEATLTCCDGFSAGYYPVTITCEVGGWSDPSDSPVRRWTQPEEICIENDCYDAQLPYVSHGTYYPEDFSVGSVAILHCAPGKAPDGPNVCSVCQKDGTWSDPYTECVVDCGYPPSYSTQTWIVEEGTKLYAKAYVQCCEGLVAKHSYIECKPSGYWGDLDKAMCRDCPEHWWRHGDSCYRIKRSSCTNRQAIDACDDWDTPHFDSHLVKIRSVAERDFVRGKMGTYWPRPMHGFWIGLYQKGPVKGSEVWWPGDDWLNPTVSGWATGKPGSDWNRCTLAASALDFWWSDVECANDWNAGVDDWLGFPMCQIDLWGSDLPGK